MWYTNEWAVVLANAITNFGSLTDPEVGGPPVLEIVKASNISCTNEPLLSSPSWPRGVIPSGGAALLPAAAPGSPPRNDEDYQTALWTGQRLAD
jgi:hypothetical protein